MGCCLDSKNLTCFFFISRSDAALRMNCNIRKHTVKTFCAVFRLLEFVFNKLYSEVAVDLVDGKKLNEL